MTTMHASDAKKSGCVALAALASSLHAEQLRDALTALAEPVAAALDPAALGYASARTQK